MLSKYNIKWGLILSLFIALLTCIPWLIRADWEQFGIRAINLFLRILVCWFIHYFFVLYEGRGQFWRSAKCKGIASILIGVIVNYGINYCFRGDAVPYTAIGTGAITNEQADLINVFRSFFISGFCYFVVYYLQVNIQLQKSRLENEYLKQDQLEAQLFSLQHQLSPHFLFNSLSTLKTIAPDQATKTYVMQLSRVYRYLLTFHTAQKVTVESELAFMRAYLYIIKERFEDAFQVAIAIDEKYMHYYIPPLSLQILVENALKHNVVSAEQPLHLRVYTDDNALLMVENSYQPRVSVEESVGKGLKNINDRYQLLAGRQIDVVQDNAHFTVTLPLLLS